MNSTRLTAVVLALVGLLSLSSIALAEHEEGHPEDTWFSFGYDPIDHFLAINISPNDVDDCKLENGTLTATYGEPEDGIYQLELDAPYDICEVSGVVVAGPNGQVNHGQFMKAANELIDGPGRGCLMRHLAQSDIGKTDETKVNTPDVEVIEIGEDGEFTFMSEEVDCSKNNKDKEDKGRPDSPGKAGDAPGRNK